MAYTYEEFKKRRAAEKQSVSAADTGSAAKTQRSGYTYDEFMARRQERLRAEEEKKAMQPLEDAYRAAGEKATADAEAAEKRYGEASVGMSPALQLRRAILGNPKIDTSEDPQKEYEEALKEYAAAKEEADFYRQHQTYADLQKYVEEEEKKAQKKAARFTEYTDEAGKAALSRYKSDDDEYIVVNGEVLNDGGLTVAPTIDGKSVTYKEYGEHLKGAPSYDWTDDERRRFAYLNERDPEDAAEYAREINKAHAAEAQEKERAKREEFATSSFLAEIATTAENVLLGGPEGLMDYFATLLDPEFKEYLKGLTPYDANSAGVAAIAEKLNKEGVISESVPIFGGKGLGDAYQLAVSILQSTVYGVIGNITGTQIFTFIGFFGQAAAGGINEAKAKGATDEQAIIYGTLAGFFEGLFEEVSLDKIWKMSSPTTLKALVKNLLKSSTIEASEEFATTMADALAEKFILAEKSDWEKEGFLKVLEGAIYDAAAGFVSGFAQGGAHTIVTAASTVQAGKNITAEERASLKENIAKLSETAEGKKKIDIPTDSKSKLINDYTSGAMLEAFADLYGYEGKKNIFGKIKTPYENGIKNALVSFGKTSQMSDEAIKDMTDGFDGTLDADVYAKGFYDYYEAGKSGVSFDKVSTAASGELRGSAAAIAYNDGRIAGIKAGMQKTATTAENVDVAAKAEETATAADQRAEEANAGRVSLSWAFGKNGRRAYSGGSATSPAVYDGAMFRVYADAYAGKSDAAIYKTVSELYGNAVSEESINDMIEAAIADRAEKKTVKIVRREGKVNFEGVKLNAKEKRALSVLAQFAGVDIDFADLGDANGRYADGKITIDTSAENPLAVVLGHEAFHRFREIAPREAEVVERLAYEAATEKDPDILEKVIGKYASAKGAAFGIGDAVEEIAADYMGDIVESPEKLSALIKLANTKKKKSALARFIAWVRERWENFKSRRNGELSGAEEKTDEAVDAIVDMMRRAKIELAGVPVTTGETIFGEEVPIGDAVENNSNENAETEITAEEVADETVEEIAEEPVEENATENTETESEAESVAKAEKEEPQKTVKAAKPVKKMTTEKIVKSFANEAAKAKAQYPAVRVITRGDYWVGDSFSLVKVSKDVYDDYAIGKTFSTENYPRMKLQEVRTVEQDHGERLLEKCIHDDGSYVRATEAKVIDNIVALVGENGTTYIDLKHLKRFAGYEIRFDPGALRAVHFYDGDEIIGFALPLKHNANATENREWQDFNLETLKPIEADETKYSLKKTSEEAKKINTEALEHFGRTYKWVETGYLLTDGTKLDFSGRHEGGPGGYRSEDHRDISQISHYEEYDGVDAMIDFMRLGNIRIMPEGAGINLSVLPTKAQEDALADFISKNRGEVTLDIDNENGETVVSVEYPRGTYFSRVLQDIRNYFNDGAIPKVSNVAEFHTKYSLKKEPSQNSSIKQQIRNNLDKLNSMKTVSTATYEEKSKGEMRKEASTAFKKIGYKVDIKDFGIVLLGENELDAAFNYLNDQAEYAAITCVPDVLKRGLMLVDEIHGNHKGRGFETVTFAGPVKINGIRGNMAVIVKSTTKNRYKTHRILMPDGSEFVFAKKETELTSSGVNSNNEFQRADISSVNTIISQNDEKSTGKLSLKEKDAEYLKAVEAGDTATAQRMVDEAAREAGYNSPKMYHGTPNGTFTVFRNWQYFTENKEYADVYQNQGASSNGYKRTADNPKTYAVYIKTENLFDTRNAKEREIFMREFYRKYGNGTPLSERSLPDWTDADDLIEFFDEKGYDYDGILLDEGGTGGYGNEVKSRGISWMIRDPQQTKSADPVTYDDDGNVIPLSERFADEKKDFRFSLKKTSAEAKIAELEKEIDRIKNGGVLTGGTVPSPTKMKKLVDELFEGYAGEKTKRALSDELSDVYAKMSKYVKKQNGAEKDAAWAKISEKLTEISADICRGTLDSTTVDATERLKLYSEDMSRAVLAQKVEIMCELFEMPNYVTAADKIEALKAEKADALKKVREQRAKTVKALKLAETTDAEIDQKYYESEARKKLLHIARRLGRVKGNASQALIDEFVRGAVDCISSLKELDTVSLGMRTSTKDYLRDLSAWYSEQKRNADFYGDEKTEAELARLSKMEINQMSIRDVEALTEALLNVENTIRTQNKLIDSEDKRNFQEQGGVVINDVNHLAGINKGLWDEIVTQSLSPIRAISRITGYNDSDPLMMRTRELNDGQRNMLSWIVKYKTMFNEFTSDTEYMKKLTGKHADIVLRSGDGIMTRGMLISLYLHSMNSQNMKHIELGGAVLPNAELYKAGKVRDAYARKTILKMSRSQIINLANEHLSERDFAFAALIKKYFNVEAKAGINEVSNKLLGYDLAKVGEYFPISVNGAFTKAEYEQIKCDGSVAGMGNLKERTDSSLPIDLVDATTVLNRAIELNAKYIGLAVPVRNMSKLLRIAKVQSGVDMSGNVVLEKILGGDGFEHFVYDTSVMDAIEKKWGANASDYIKKMLADVQGLNVKDRNAFTDLFDVLRSNYAQAVLTLNPGVAIKQTASFPTAAAVIGWKPLMKALGGRRVNLDVVSKYTPLLAYRSLGYTDADLGMIVKRGRHIPAPLNWVQKMDILTTRRLFAACEYYIEDTKPNLKRWSEEYYKAVAEVYNRVIEETQPNYTAMQRPQMLRSNDTLLKNLAMFKTQPMQNLNLIYDAIGNYRAKKTIMMQDPTAENKAAFKEAGTRLGRVISSQIVQAAMMAAITLAWNAARGKFKRYTGDNDDENVLQGSAFARMIIDVVENLVSGFPGASEITSFCEAIVSAVTTGQFSYYGIEAATPAMISDAATSVLDATQELYRIVDGTASTEKVVRSAENLAGEIGKMFGVPIGNVDNIVKIIFRVFGVEW